MNPILAEAQGILDKLSSPDGPEMSMSGGGLLMALAAIKVRKKLVRVLMVLLALGLIGFAVYRRLNRP